jgi:hypothetical protein
MKRAHLLGLSLLALLNASALLVGLEGCSKPETETVDPVDEGTREKPSFYLEKGLTHLRRASTAESDSLSRAPSRAAVEELNKYLKAQRLRFSLDPRDRVFFKDQLHLDPKELDEVDSRVFTPLDAHYLQFCVQMADVARSLDLQGLSTLERAHGGFDWVIRQVTLKERVGIGGKNEPVLAPQDVLDLGFGRPRERALIFLALLEQLAVPGGLVAVPHGGESQWVYWIPGVLVEKEEKDQHGRRIAPGFYLFDTRLGLPLPGVRDGETATLAQVRKNPATFRALFPQGGDAVIPERIDKAEIHLAFNLSALSPRIRHLEQKLSAAEKMVLALDPLRMKERFKNEVTGCPVRFWTSREDVNTPARVFRKTLEQGGGEEKRRLLLAGAKGYPFVWYPHYPPDLRSSSLYNMLDNVVYDKILRYCESARTLLVRGRFDDAVKPVNAGQDYLERLKDRFLNATRDEKQTAELRAQIKKWCEAVQEAQLAVDGAKEEARARDAAARKQPDLARGRLNQLFKEDTPPFNLIAYTILAEPLAKEGGYLLGLCLQEKAERNQTRLLHLARPGGAGHPNRRVKEEAVASWRNADNQWKRFEDKFALNLDALPERFKEINRQAGNFREAFFQALDLDISRTVAVRLLRARALENLGHPKAALKLLREQLQELQEMKDSLKLFQKHTGTDNVFWLGLAAARQVDRLKKFND